MSMMGAKSISKKPNYRYENKEYLLKTIMNQLGITESDLDEQEPSWVKAKVRESNIDKILSKD